MDERVAVLAAASPASVALCSLQFPLSNEAAGSDLKASELFAPKLEELFNARECVWNGMLKALLLFSFKGGAAVPG